MFKFLKDKIQAAVKSLSKKVEEIPEEKVQEVLHKEREQTAFEKEITEQPKEKKIAKEQAIEEVIVEEKQSFFKKITEKVTTTKITDKEFNELFWDIELILLENNVAVEVIDKLKEDVKVELVNAPLKRGKVEETIKQTLRESLSEIIHDAPYKLEEKVKTKKPFVICFVGINGAGKTTSIAKVANLLQQKKLSCVLAASDTFRAAAIQQLEEHAKRLDVKIVKHDYGSDSAAVAFDAIEHAKAKGKDVVLIDTAGRLHSNKDLMNELHKVIRVAKPDLTVFIGEAITGNDCIEQAKEFNSLIGIDAIILAKSDVDEKGGTALSISFVTGKPILYLGTGQNYQDLEFFEKEKILDKLGLHGTD